MRRSETIALVYLAYLAGLVWFRPIGFRRRCLVTCVSIVEAALILVFTRMGQGWLAIVRDWVPGLYLLIGYWLSGAFFVSPMPRLERWLADGDDVVFTTWGVERWVRRTPRWVLEFLELSYLCVYPVVPAGFAIVQLAPIAHHATAADEYWSVILATGFFCYGLLPWLQTRPPVALGLHVAIEQRSVTIRRLNTAIRTRASVQANTVPSGHAATACAIALTAGSLVPPALLPLTVLALSITTASVVGRYHFAVDAALGTAVAMTVWAILS